MRTIKIVADSSANLLQLSHIPFASAPLKVITDAREFADNTAPDVDGMLVCFEKF